MATTHPITFAVPAAGTAIERYRSIVHPIQAWLLQVFPQARKRYPVGIFIPATDLEYADTVGAPLRNLADNYASTSPPARLTVFASRHQTDLAAFDGVLSGGVIGEVDAVKTIVHELIHLASPGPYAGRAEKVVVECATELLAVVMVAAHVPFDGLETDLKDNLVAQVFYANRFPWFADVVIGATGSAQSAVELCKWLVAAHPSQALGYLAYLISAKFSVRKPDAVDFIYTDAADYDTGLNTLLTSMTTIVNGLKADPTVNTVRWLLDNATLLA